MKVLVALISSPPIVRSDCIVVTVVTYKGKTGTLVIDDETFQEFKSHPDRFEEGRPLLVIEGPDSESPHKDCPIKTVRLPVVDDEEW